MDRYQLAAARGMLGWSLKELSEKTNLTPESINRIERGEIDNPRRSTIQTLKEVFESEGIEFTEQSGIRLRNNALIEFHGTDAYQQIIEHAYTILKNKEGEIWVLFGEDEVSSKEVIESELRLRRHKIHMRFVVSESNNFLRYPLEEYRTIPKQYFRNNPIVVYSDFVAIFYPDQMKAEIRRHAGLAACIESMAKLIYSHGKKPSHTICEDTHE